MSEGKGLCDLIRDAQAGDASARAALMDRFAPCVEHLCRDASFYTDADLSATDLMQEAWLRIWQKFQQFRGTGDEQHVEVTLFNWLRQTARSVIVNLGESRNTQRRRPPTPVLPIDVSVAGGSSVSSGHRTLAAGDRTPSEIAIAREEAQLIEAAIESLGDPLDREIIRSRFFAGASLAETAGRLGIHYDEVRTRFHKSLEQLDRALTDFK
jgi:RNA polymerase sigma factor (sigma-70 family)